MILWIVWRLPGHHHFCHSIVLYIYIVVERVDINNISADSRYIYAASSLLYTIKGNRIRKVLQRFTFIESCTFFFPIRLQYELYNICFTLVLNYVITGHSVTRHLHQSLSYKKYMRYYFIKHRDRRHTTALGCCTVLLALIL